MFALSGTGQQNRTFSRFQLIRALGAPGSHSRWVGIQRSRYPSPQRALASHSYLCAHGQTQVYAPHDAHRAAKDNPLVYWHPQEADKAYRGPEFVSILHHRPQLIRAVARDRVHGVDARLVLRIDIGHVAQEHERVDDGADGLVKQELDEDVRLAERRLGGVGLRAWLLGRRGGGGHVGRELVFEVALPDYVGWGAEDAEERELEDGGIVEGEGRLDTCQLHAPGHGRLRNSTYAVFVG